MAKFITAMENVTKMDTQSKKDLQDNYKEVQKKKRAKMLARKTKVIRKLLDNGGNSEEIEDALLGIADAEESDEDDDGNFIDENLEGHLA